MPTVVVAVVAIIITIAALVIWFWTTLTTSLIIRWPVLIRHPETVPQTQNELEEPFFRAEFVGKKQAYRKGEYIRFRSRFTGWLYHGFRANIITAPEIAESQDLTRHRTFSYTLFVPMAVDM